MVTLNIYLTFLSNDLRDTLPDGAEGEPKEVEKMF